MMGLCELPYPRLPGCIANTTLRWAGFTPAEARMAKVSSAARRALVAGNEENWSQFKDMLQRLKWLNLEKT